METSSLRGSIRVALLRPLPEILVVFMHSNKKVLCKQTMACCTSGLLDGAEKRVKDVLLQVEHEEQFAVATSRATLAKQAAKFILASDTTAGFLQFSQNMNQALHALVEKVKQAGYKTFATTESKLWRHFHVARGKELKEIWEKLWIALGSEAEKYKRDPILMQYCNSKLFEQTIKESFDVTLSGLLRPSHTLSDDEENALRYAAGFTVRSVRKKIDDRTHHPYRDEMLKILDALRVERADGNPSTYLAYTKSWLSRVNRGGLFQVSNDTHLLFLAMQYATRTHLESAFIRANKEEIIAKIIGDPDVSFHWSRIIIGYEQVVSQEVLKRLALQWMTIHGFSSVADFMEDYKHAKQILLKSKKALRKELEKNSSTSNSQYE